MKLPRHVFREPFTHKDRLVYFRLSAAADGYAPSPLDKDLVAAANANP